MTAPGGTAGESSAAGAGTDGGAPNEPDWPGSSSCGAGKFETGTGCAACPSPPSPSLPALIACQAFGTAEKLDEDLQVTFDGLAVHEALGGQVSVSWLDSTGATLDGQADVPWSYSPADGQFLFDLPIDARYADRWDLSAWTFTDACGFKFAAPKVRVEYDGVEYDCNDPT